MMRACLPGRSPRAGTMSVFSFLSLSLFAVLTDYQEFDQTGGPSACDGLVIGDNSKCEPSNDPWDVPGDECTSSYAYVGL